jgi:hypothetical protein
MMAAGTNAPIPIAANATPTNHDGNECRAGKREHRQASLLNTEQRAIPVMKLVLVLTLIGIAAVNRPRLLPALFSRRRRCRLARCDDSSAMSRSRSAAIGLVAA